jgi:hypothetical protein
VQQTVTASTMIARVMGCGQGWMSQTGCGKRSTPFFCSVGRAPAKPSAHLPTIENWYGSFVARSYEISIFNDMSVSTSSSLRLYSSMMAFRVEKKSCCSLVDISMMFWVMKSSMARIEALC